MDPLWTSPVQVLCDKFIGKKWKDFIASIFESTAFGCARLELYATEAKLRSMEPHRVILLDGCVSIRPTIPAKGPRFIKLQMKDNTSISITSDSLYNLQSSLSKAAFPTKYVSISPSSSTSADSPISDTPGELLDKIPVLLLPTTLSRSKRIAEGNYDLDFKDMLILKVGCSCIDAWEYNAIIWVATGEHCIGFEVESLGMLEFKCSHPSLVMDNFRRFMTFGSVFTPIAKKTVNSYNRTYTAVKKQKPISHSPLDEAEEEFLSTTENDSRSSTARTADSGISSPDEIARSTLSSNPIISASMQLILEENLNKMKEKEKQSSRIFSFFRRNSSKRNRDQKQRDDFEQNADDEWTRMPTSTSAQSVKYRGKGIENALRFKAELEKTIAENKARALQHSTPDLSQSPLNGTDFHRALTQMDGNERCSVACSEPANRYEED